MDSKQYARSCQTRILGQSARETKLAQDYLAALKLIRRLKRANPI